MTLNELKNRLEAEKHITGSIQIELGKKLHLHMCLLSESMKRMVVGIFMILLTGRK